MTFLPKILFSTILFLVKTHIPETLPVNLEVEPTTADTTFATLGSGTMQYGVMGDKTETGDHYVVVVIPEFDEEKLNTTSSSAKSLSVGDKSLNFDADQTITEDVGTMQVYFRRLKDMEGSKEVLSALEKGDSDEFSKELKKRHKGSSFTASVNIHLEIDLRKDLLNDMQVDYGHYQEDLRKYSSWEKGNSGTSITDTELKDIFNNGDEAFYQGATETDTAGGWDLAAYNGNELFGGSKVRLKTDAVVDSENDADNAYAVGKTFYQNLYVKEDADTSSSNVGWSVTVQPVYDMTGSATINYPNRTPAEVYSFPKNLKFALKVVWDVTESGFKITNPNDKNKSLLDLSSNGDLEMGEVTKSMEKKYHNLTALWVVIGIVGAALIIGIICACLCC